MCIRDSSGQGDYVPIDFGKLTFLAVQTPVYRGGALPSTVASRRAAFVGWIGMSVVPDVILDTALQGHPGIAVSLRYGESTSDVLFADGKAAAGSQHVTISLHNGDVYKRQSSRSSWLPGRSPCSPNRSLPLGRNGVTVEVNGSCYLVASSPYRCTAVTSGLGPVL